MEDILRALSVGGLAPSRAQRHRAQEDFLATVFGDAEEKDRILQAKKWARALAKTGKHNSPPTNLRAVLARVKARVRTTEMSGAGRLVVRPDGNSVVFVNRRLPASAQRFTIAHEVGHLLLRRIAEKKLDATTNNPASAAFAWTSSYYQERLCDLIAAELLMPQPLMDRFCGATKDEGFALVHQISRAFGTSFTASLIRVIDCNMPYLAIFWKESTRPGSTTKLRVMWSQEPPNRELPFIPRLKPTPDATLIHDVLASKRSGEGWVNLGPLNMGEDAFFVEAMPFKNGVLGLVHLDRKESHCD